MATHVYDVVHLVTQLKSLMKGFGLTQQPTKSAAYWIAAYAKDNEDEPIDVYKKVLSYKPGQDKELLMIRYCNSVMKINRNIWEMLIHQGPTEIPDSGDQIVLRLSREKFKGSAQVN